MGKHTPSQKVLKKKEACSRAKPTVRILTRNKQTNLKLKNVSPQNVGKKVKNLEHNFL